MHKLEIEDKLTGIFNNIFDNPKVEQAKSSEVPNEWFKILKGDSLDILQLVIYTEETFHIEVDDEEVLTWDTFNAIVEYISEEIEKQR